MISNELKTADENSRKKLDRIQNTFVIIGVLTICWATWRFQKGHMAKNQCLYWYAVIFFPVFLMDACFSLKSGISWAKGVKISRDVNPIIFKINVVLSILCASACFIYAIWHWTIPFS
jgi:uncharacterized membrane protein YidH (DUF202 family)